MSILKSIIIFLKHIITDMNIQNHIYIQDYFQTLQQAFIIQLN